MERCFEEPNHVWLFHFRRNYMYYCADSSHCGTFNYSLHWGSWLYIYRYQFFIHNQQNLICLENHCYTCDDNNNNQTCIDNARDALKTCYVYKVSQWLFLESALSKLFMQTDYYALCKSFQGKLWTVVIIFFALSLFEVVDIKFLPAL